MAFHPRDAFILHQEQIQRQNEGDEVDTSAEQKVQIDLQRLTDTESTATVTFSHEDHTLGNPLRHVLMQHAEVTSAGYTIPHPLEAKMVLHVQSTDYAVEAVATGLERLAEICDQTLKSFDDCMHRTNLHNKKRGAMSASLTEPKTSVIVNGRKRITSKFTDASELIEEFDVITDELLLRKRRSKNTLGSLNEWVVEVGSEARVRNLDKELLVEASGSPELVKQDTPQYHVFRIRNLPYPKEVFSVTVERHSPDGVGEIVVRTTNKKYFKRLSIPELERHGIPLDASSLSFEVQHNTLIIRYKKHLAVLAVEAAAKKERAALPSKRVNEGEAGCPQQ